MDGDASFGYWLRLRRKAQRLSCVELARRLGCATITLRKIEADERRPSEQIATRLAEHLNVTPQERPTFIKGARGELGERSKNHSNISAKGAPRTKSPSRTATCMGCGAASPSLCPRAARMNAWSICAARASPMLFEAQ